jgi:hypothetical protein
VQKSYVGWRSFRRGSNEVAMDNAEQSLRGTIPVYVGSFNQPSYLHRMVENLVRNGFGNIIIADNASTSPKTLDYLSSCEVRPGITVWRIGENIGPDKAVDRILASERGRFIFTDPDLELANQLPSDFLGQLLEISRRYRCRKVGLALEIPPENETRQLRFVNPLLGTFTIQEWEGQFWERKLESGVYRAGVDTTFFLWNPEIRIDLRRLYLEFVISLRPRLRRLLPKMPHPDIRVARPGFVARHLPWYKDDKFPEDERDFYLKTTSRASTWLRDT